MKLNLFITIFLFPVLVSAQKLLKPDIDKITGDTTWSTSKEKLYFHGNYLTLQGEAVTFQVIRSSNTHTELLVLYPQSLNMDQVLSIAKDQKAYLKFSDHTIITLVSSVDDYGNSKYDVVAHMPQQNSSAAGYYNLPETVIEKLKTATLVFLRIETTTINFDCDIKPKNAKMLIKAIGLIANVK